MTAQNFTVADLVAIFCAFWLFSLFGFIPGYVLGWCGNLLGFRKRTLIARILLSGPLSVALCPILAYLLGRYVSMGAVWLVFGAMWLIFGILLAAGFRPKLLKQKLTLDRYQRILVVVVAGWLVIGALSLVDLQLGNRLYFPSMSFDHCTRAAVTSAIAREGLPPANPFFSPGRAVPLRYHYFWMIAPALLSRASGTAISTRMAMGAATLWCGMSLIFVIPLYLRYFDLNGRDDIGVRSLIGIGLLGVTGLDILPTLFLAFTNGLRLPLVVFPDMESWNEQITSWIGTALWVPHHLSALVACLVGFLLFWTAKSTNRFCDRIAGGIASALAFATATGTSVYVTFVFALFLTAWAALSLVAKRFRDFTFMTCIGVGTILLSVPYLRDLQLQDTSGEFLRLTVRKFGIAEALLTGEATWRIITANILLLPLNYCLEVGFFWFAAAWQLRRYYRTRRSVSQQDLAYILMAATSVVVCTFLRSTVISANDLGWRGFLIAQFVLLLWAVEFIRERNTVPYVTPEARRSPRRFVTAALILGATGTVYQVVIFRTFPILADRNLVLKATAFSLDDQLGERTYAAREVYENLKRTTPAAFLLQHNPRAVPNDLFFGLYAERQAAADTPSCSVVFGGDPAACKAVVTRVDGLFRASGAIDAGQIDAACRDLRISVLVVKDTDEVWADRRSWVWTRSPRFANEHARAFDCGQAVSPRPPG